MFKRYGPVWSPEGAGGAGAAAGAAAGAGNAGAAAGAGAGAGAGQAAGTPWYEGKAETSTIGLWDNKGWDKSDPAKVALEASKAYGELYKHYGVPADQLLKLPAKPDDAEWSNVWSRLGKPAEAKDYDFAEIKDNPGFVEAMRAALHKANVAKDAAPELLKGAIKYLTDEKAKDDTVRSGKAKLEIETLRKEWGADFEFNRLTAMQGARRLGVDETALSEFEGLVGYGKLMEVMRRVGAAGSEASWIDGGKGGSGPGVPTTRAGAQAEFERLSQDPSWSKKVTSGSTVEVQQFNELMRRIGADEGLAA